VGVVCAGTNCEVAGAIQCLAFNDVLPMDEAFNASALLPQPSRGFVEKWKFGGVVTPGTEGWRPASARNNKLKEK